MDLEKQYVCVDVETTGLNPDKDEIVEVYARRFKEDGSRGKEFYSLCKPMSCFIPEEASNIHGITMEKVASAPGYLADGIREALVGFIGDRKVIGHNLISFDLKFLKIQPKETEDTLVMCRSQFNSGNSLRKACDRAGIKFDSKKAHSAGYDVERCIDLYLLLKGFKTGEDTTQTNLFSQPQPAVPSETKQPQSVVQVDPKSLFTQPYSYSRINLFHQCPFKWKKRYIEKVYEPEQPHLLTGSICHKIAEKTAIWCYRETFASKFAAYETKAPISLDQTFVQSIMDELKCKKPTDYIIGKYLFDNPKVIRERFGLKGMAHLITHMDEVIEKFSIPYEKASMPDLDTYNKIMQETILQYKCNDPAIITDVEHIMLRFYKTKDFSNRFGQLALVEKQLAFDKNWNYLSDWKSDEVFFRGIIDVIEYMKEFIRLSDYKSSRTMLNPEQAKRDMQLKVYMLLLYKFLPKGSFNKIVAAIDYLRFGKTVEFEVENIEQMAKEAEQWINDSIKQIEAELLKDSQAAFPPKRNEYCYCCYLGDQGICPLFNRKHINDINDIETFEVAKADDCKIAWKRIEVNKREIKNLTSKCKTFLKNSETKVMVDNEAKLDFYIKESREYDAAEVLKLALNKGVDIKVVIEYFGISPTNVDKLINKNKIELNEEEINKISRIKTSHEFDACTEDEARANGYMNP